MYARYVFVWMNCCGCYHCNSACRFVGRGFGLYLFTVRPVSSSAGLYVLHLDRPEQPIACPPYQRAHNRFWCYSDRRGAYGLTLSVIWPPALITVSDALIPECNDLSQFSEDTGKPSVPDREFNHSMPASLIELEKPPSRPGFEPRPAKASRHCGLYWCLAHYATRTGLYYW